MKVFSDQLSFEVTWKPFFLNRTTPESGIPLEQYLSQKYGPEAAATAKQGTGHLSMAGANVGINFNFDRRIVNTLKSHCMLDYAKSEGKQDQLAENLFQAYFEEAKDINCIDVLAKIAVDTGLNMDAMETHMKKSAVISRVQEEAMEAHDEGINGVPYFKIRTEGENRAVASFSGAQPPDTFKSIFHRLLTRLKSSV
ncbi:uncharacterized protein [Montipora foliosa]|uniref:uncharacterized protein n=1 Tax=Montipora foliosa TaxID=591990 RepID=UPI0035F0FCB5